MNSFSDLILRWSCGFQNTQTLSSYEIESKYRDYIWLTKLSVRSFQNWFPGARFVLLYNGYEIERFKEIWASTQIDLLYETEIIDQCHNLKTGIYQNPYHYYPIGVWWKWIPFRLDITKHEIAVDTDIICINEPQTWYKWIDGQTSILVAPERFDKIKVNTCGDLYAHPILRDKTPANCGVVGQRANENYADRFFEITKLVRFGHTHDSLFITEQGAINLWIYSLENEGITHTILDFKSNVWVRDFVYWMVNKYAIETIHAVAWHKEVVKKLKKEFEDKVLNRTDDEHFLQAVLKEAANFSGVANTMILRQLQGNLDREIYLVQIP